MDRKKFEFLRDLPDKIIEGDIILQSPKDNRCVLEAHVSITNSEGFDAKLRVAFNTNTGDKCINVYIIGVGPVCRLEVDAREHRPYGRSHKHSLKQPDCPNPGINLSRDIAERADLSGKNINEVFADFCKNAKIVHHGNLIVEES